MRLEDMRPNMKATALYDDGLRAGTGRGQVVLYEILKVGRAKVKVRDEHGREGWIYPSALHREITDERYAEIMEESYGAEWRTRFGGSKPEGAGSAPFHP